MEVICDVCNAVLSSKYILKTHMTTNKACLAIRNMELKTKFLCKGCDQYSLDMQKLTNHQEICKSYQRILLQEEFDLKLLDIENLNKKLKKEMLEKDKEIKSLQTINEKLKEEIGSLFTKDKDEKIKDLQSQIDKMFSTIEKLASQAIDKPNTTINTNNNVKNVYSDKYFLEKLTPGRCKEKM
jgi:predicted RNase H-like nuclease (RuvC/YqgF family)